MALPGKKFNTNPDNNNVSPDNGDFENDELSSILSSFSNSFTLDEYDSEDAADEEDVFTGFNEDNEDKENSVNNPDDEIVNNPDDEEDGFVLDLDEPFNEEDSFSLTDLNISALDKSFSDDEDEEDGEESSEVGLSEYQDVLDSEPENNHNVRKEYSEIQGEDEDNESLTPADYRLLTVHETVHNIDMVNKEDKSGTPLEGSHINRATGRRIYDRNGRGVLSNAQLMYFTNLSKRNLSNARYPDEYVNLVRSNEELLDSGQRMHKKLVKDFLSKGIDENARDHIAKRVNTRITRSDEELLEIIARMKYASTMQLSRATSRQFGSVNKALNGLRQRKLVKNADSPYYDQRLWCLTEVGMMVSNYDLAVPDSKGISVGSLQHTTVVNNIAAFVYSGRVNVLNLEPFPPRNRVTSMGRVVAGDEFVSETQLRTSLGRLVMNYNTSGTKGDVYIPIVKAEIDRQFETWEYSFTPDNPIPSPEREYGNEYMWILYPPPYLGIVQHIPDLVVPRDRNPDGSPESIAVEIELKPKAISEYIRTLRSYEADDRIYKKVVWVCSRKRTANLLLKAAQESTNLLDDGRLDVVPIESENGVFKGTNVLALG